MKLDQSLCVVGIFSVLGPIDSKLYVETTDVDLNASHPKD